MRKYLYFRKKKKKKNSAGVAWEQHSLIISVTTFFIVKSVLQNIVYRWLFHITVWDDPESSLCKLANSETRGYLKERQLYDFTEIR